MTVFNHDYYRIIGELGFESERISNWKIHRELSGIGIQEVGIYTYQTIFITKSNQVFVCGNNTSNQLGVIDKKESSSLGYYRHSTLEKYCKEHSSMVPHVTGGFQHMIVYFAKDGKFVLVI